MPFAPDLKNEVAIMRGFRRQTAESDQALAERITQQLEQVLDIIVQKGAYSVTYPADIKNVKQLTDLLITLNNDATISLLVNKSGAPAHRRAVKRVTLRHNVTLTWKYDRRTRTLSGALDYYRLLDDLRHQKCSHSDAS